MAVSIRIPETLTKNLFPNTPFDELNDAQITHTKKCAKQLIERAIIENKLPASVRLESENDFVGHLTINILNKYNRAIIKHARQNKTPEAVIALGYLVCALNHDWHLSLIENEETRLSDYLNAMNYEVRDEQQRFYRFLDDTITKQKVGLIEASTGVGKSLAILSQANERALNENKVCVISTNSLANIQQYIADYRNLTAKDVEMSPLYLIIGRQNFVSSERLFAWIDSCELPINRDRIDAWLNRGGRNENEPDYLPAMSLASLKDCEPMVIDSEVTLNSNVSDNDKGYLAYQAQFTLSHDTQHAILLVTHTMLCIDTKFRRLHHDLELDVIDEIKSLRAEVDRRFKRYDELELGDKKDKAYEAYSNARLAYNECRMAALRSSTPSLLPNYQYLFVDEGHLLENAMCNVTSENISLRSIIRDVKQYSGTGKATKSKISEAENAITELIDSQQKIKTEQLVLSNQTEHHNYLLHTICSALIGNTKKAKIDAPWREQLIALKASLNRIGKRNFACILSFSPVRHYPQINTGETNTLGYLSDIWARAEAVAIVSATLYIKRYNTYSSNYISNILGISRQRRIEYPPIVAKWTKDIVKTVYMPPADKQLSDDLTPVGRSFRGNETERSEKKSRWDNAIAERIVNIYTNAPGGTLVLMTAYADCIAVSEIIKRKLTDIPLVVANNNTTLNDQKIQYIELTKSGTKPLWLAVGNAWVGLDINGKSIGLGHEDIFEKDNVITDLVIPKIPFGANNSLSHILRMMKLDNNTSDIELMETMMKFKQGLGRLVRLEQQRPNRQIHILDGRLNQPRYKGFLSLIRALIDTYPNVLSMDYDDNR